MITVGAVCAVLAAPAGAASAAAAAAAPPACPGADALPGAPASVAATRAAVACLIDAARAQRGAPALKRDPKLRVAAQRYAAALDPAKPLTHRGSGGTSPLERIAKAGYGGGTFSAAETLGRAHGSVATPAARVAGWLGDPATRKLLVSARYRDVGVGVVTQAGVTTFVVELGRRGATSR